MTEEVLNGAAEAAPEPTHEPSSGDALERAFRSVGLTEDDAPAEVETPEGEEQGEPDGPARGPDGKFVAKEPKAEGEAPEAAEPEKAETPDKAEEKGHDAPSRFSADAKAEWANVPAAVKGEVGRAIRELEGGIAKYRSEMEPLRQFDEMAKQSGTTLPEAMDRYVRMENFIRQDPVQGLDYVARNMGLKNGLHDIIQMVTGEGPEQASQQQQNVIAGLRQEIEGLKSQLGQVNTGLRQRTEYDIQNQLQQFASQPGRERFDELGDTMAQLINAGMAQDLADAYEKAERLIPAPAQIAPPPPPPPPPAGNDPAAQTRKASLSVQGAPGSGSNPASRHRSKTSEEAIARAFSSLGIS